MDYKIETLYVLKYSNESNEAICDQSISNIQNNWEVNERNDRMYSKVDLHYNNCLLISNRTDSQIKYLLLDSESTPIVYFSDLNVNTISNNQTIRKLLVLNKGKSLLAICQTHYYIYQISCRQFVYQYYKPMITFVETFGQFVIMGQKFGTITLYECNDKYSLTFISSYVVMNYNRKEIIDIKMFRCNDILMLMVLIEGFEPILINGINGEILLEIPDSPTVYKPSRGLFSDNYYYLYYCDQYTKWQSISEFEPKIKVYEMDEAMSCKPLGELDFSNTNGFVTSMLAINGQSFILINTGSYSELKIYRKLQLISSIYCNFQQIISYDTKYLIASNLHGIHRIVFENRDPEEIEYKIKV